MHAVGVDIFFDSLFLTILLFSQEHYTFGFWKIFIVFFFFLSIKIVCSEMLHVYDWNSFQVIYLCIVVVIGIMLDYIKWVCRYSIGHARYTLWWKKYFPFIWYWRWILLLCVYIVCGRWWKWEENYQFDKNNVAILQCVAYQLKLWLKIF